MKHVFIFFTIALIAMTGCNENTKITEKNQGESLSITQEENGNQPVLVKENFGTKIIIRENTEDMVDITRFFSSDELDKIRNNYVKQLRHRYWVEWLMEDLSTHSSKECGDREKKGDVTAFSDKEKSENMNVTYHILLKKYPIFKPVSTELFEKKMADVFGIDIKGKSLNGQSFFTNQPVWDMRLAHYSYNIYIDMKNHIITSDNLPLLFKEEIDWDEFNKQIENIDSESIAYYDKKESLYEEYLNEALQKKFTLYCSKIHLEYLYHVNNYVFYENQASLSWLLANEGKIYQSFTSTLFDFFNYDKEPRINRINMDYDISKGFPLYPNDYERVFGVLETCPQTQYYNHFQFKVRTGLMQYIVDNCYDETDLDTFGIRNDKYICVMEDCFDYLMEFVLKGDKYKESEQCHYYQVCAYLAYYLQKAYENFVSQGNCDPRCWHNALVNNLRKDINDNDARFENYVKDNDYFGLEGFEDIMKKAHEEAMMD